MSKSKKKVLQKKKIKTKRSRVKNAALIPRFNSKIRQPTIDQDYIDKLNDKEKEWLASFMEETNNANFNHGGKKHYKTKTKKREIYNANNARQRDIMSQQQAMGRLNEFNKETEAYLENEEAQSMSDIEDSLIDYIDKKHENND